MPLAVLATAGSDLFVRLASIFHGVVLPVLLIAAIGYAIQRRGGLDMATLRRLNFYFVIPAIVYYSIVTSKLTITAVGLVVAFGLAMLVAQGALTWAAGRLRGADPSLRRAMMMTTMFYNSGNFGLPVQEMAFQPYGPQAAADAVGYQAFVMISQNLISFTIGIGVVAGGQRARRLSDTLRHIAKLPPIYAITAAVLTVQLRNALGDHAGVAAAVAPLWQVLLYVKNAFIAVAVLTLGAQLATIRRGSTRDPVFLAVALRLLAGPAIGLAVIYTLRLLGVAIDPFVAQVLLISAASPTAVNAMLLCLEFHTHPDFAARAVFFSTLLSPVTVTAVVFLAQSGLLPGF